MPSNHSFEHVSMSVNECVADVSPVQRNNDPTKPLDEAHVMNPDIAFLYEQSSTDSTRNFNFNVNRISSVLSEISRFPAMSIFS